MVTDGNDLQGEMDGKGLLYWALIINIKAWEKIRSTFRFFRKNLLESHPIIAFRCHGTIEAQWTRTRHSIPGLSSLPSPRLLIFIQATGGAEFCGVVFLKVLLYRYKIPFEPLGISDDEKTILDKSHSFFFFDENN
ncbi:Hypothetical predicted protein, partial [Olea europaea subsp. europaea]